MTDEREDIHFTVPEGVSGVRADKVLSEAFADFSRRQIQDAFDQGLVFLNEEAIQKRKKVSTDDELIFTLPLVEATPLEPHPMDLEILFEDEHLIVLNKAAGVVVHPGSGTGPDTLVHGLLEHCGPDHLSRLSGAERPGVVHRLDKETTGVIVFAKTDKAYLRMIQAFAERHVDKEYVAIVKGAMRLESGRIETAIDRHPVVRTKMHVSGKGRPSLTEWVRLESFAPEATYIRCILHTGRTHQIRVHLSSIGHPLEGDATYGYRKVATDPHAAKRVMLHAQKLGFVHPVTEEPLLFEAPVPEDMQARLSALRERTTGNTEA